METARCKGVNNLDAQYRQEFGPGEYAPVVAVIYWSFRVMVYTWSALLLFAVVGLWLWRKGRLETSRRWLKFGIWAGLTPFLINTAGWVMTEMGRQPWIVQGLLKTQDANSPRVSAGQIWLTLIGFVAALHRARRHRAVGVPARGQARADARGVEQTEREEEGEFALAY